MKKEIDSMRQILFCVFALALMGGFVIFNAGIHVSSQQRTNDSYDVRVYNVDDVATVYVNGIEVGRVTYTNTAVFDITRHLVSGRNQIRFVVHNYDESYTYGFELLRNGEVTSSFECGRLNNHGCNNDFRKGVVFDRTVTINYSRGSVSNGVINAMNSPIRPLSNRVIVTNAMANAMRTAEIAANAAAFTSTTRGDSRRQIVEQMFADGIIDTSVEAIDGQPLTVDKLVKEVTFRPVDLNGDGVTEYIVEASFSMGVCGSSGCVSWIYQKKENEWRQLVAEPTNGSISVSKRKTRTNGYLDIQLATQSGAHDQYFHSLKFGDQKYRQASCINHNYIDPKGNIMKRPRISKC